MPEDLHLQIWAQVNLFPTFFTFYQKEHYISNSRGLFYFETDKVNKFYMYFIQMYMADTNKISSLPVIL